MVKVQKVSDRKIAAYSCLQVFFARPPISEQVKTRLGRSLGVERSRALYAKILEHLIASFAIVPEYKLLLFSTEAEHTNYFKDLGLSESKILLQHGASLGERLANAFLQATLHNPLQKPILIVGTDHPAYHLGIAREAVARLRKRRAAVLGAAHDGGYYLVGLSHQLAQDESFLHQAFVAKDLAHLPPLLWSHSSIYKSQVQRFQQLGVEVSACKETLIDIDTFSDLALYQKNIGQFYKDKPQKSALSATGSKVQGCAAETSSKGEGFVTKKKSLPNAKQKLSNRTGVSPSLDLAEFLPDLRVVLPVWNEAENLPSILKHLFATGYFREVICADNGSTDDSVSIAKSMGARVTHCKRLGYGSTCLQAIKDIQGRGGCEVVLFLDADGSDDLRYLYEVIVPTLSGRYDLCLGARNSKLSDKGALLPHARLGNWLATTLVRWIWGFRYHDLGPLRSIRWPALEELVMDDPDFGWTIQMQIRSLKARHRILEVPIAYHKRAAGQSKISATLKGSVQAGFVILRTIWRETRMRKL